LQCRGKSGDQQGRAPRSSARGGHLSGDQHRIGDAITPPISLTSGCLMSYGVNSADLHRRAAPYVDSYPQGRETCQSPSPTPTKFELVLNLTSAKALGLTVPDKLLALADEVIE
jgi:hypothetical protein